MRFVSNSAKLCLGNFRNAEEAIEAAREVVIDGVRRATTPEAYVVSKAIPIQFSQEGLRQSDVEAAQAHWKKWPGLPLEEDGITPWTTVDRIGVWDSVEWQATHRLGDGEREQAEKLLLDSPVYGTVFVQVSEVRAAAPWATYSETHHNKIPVLAAELGCVAEALAYERENKNRASVIAALEERQGTAERPEGETVYA